jgi:hypothetical protein
MKWRIFTLKWPECKGRALPYSKKRPKEEPIINGFAFYTLKILGVC